MTKLRRVTKLVLGVVAVGLVVVTASCGGGEDDGAAGRDESPDPTATSVEGESTVPSDDGGAELADDADAEEYTVDVAALCVFNDELAVFNEQELSKFEPGADAQQALATVAEIESRLVEMSQVAPQSIRDDLQRYSSAVADVFALVIDNDFDFEAIPQREIDAFGQEHPDLNLFKASPVEDGLRSWFEENCSTEFAF